MTPDERSLLLQFLSDLTRTQGVAKDPEAAQMIDQAIRANPDGAYVLVQHALMADQALHEAQARIAALQSQLQSAPQPPPPSFFGGAGLGPRVQPQPGYASGQGGYAPAQPSPWASAAGAPPQAPGQGLFSGGGGLGSFLRTAGTAAAGVAGGELLFSGLSNVFGGHGGGFGGGFGGGGFGGGEENVTINNYGDDQGDDGGGWDDQGGDDGN